MKRRFLSGLLAFCVFLLGAGVGLFGAIPIPRIAITWSAAEDAPREIQAAGPGVEWILVYIGSSRCGWSNDDHLIRAVRAVTEALSNEARERGLGFATLGIAADGDVRAGLAHLSKVGRFDEVTTGRGWSNEALQRFVWRDVPGPAATPQLVLLRVDRDYAIGLDDFQRDGLTLAGVAMEVLNQRLLWRAVGQEEIEGWLDAGVGTRIADSADRE